MVGIVKSGFVPSFFARQAAVVCPVFYEGTDPHRCGASGAPKKSGGGKVGKTAGSARRFYRFVTDIFGDRVASGMEAELF
jgi:hypothetical protein